MILPTKTHQQKKVRVVNGKPQFYEPAELKTVRAKFTASLAAYAPEKPMQGAVRLVTKWLFPISGKRHDGEYKTTKPDTDNLVKMLKDVMTDSHFWHDDAQVASEIIEKFWALTPGLYVCVEEIGGDSN
jgi:Holliday junction resolvase RusA-like endonuclease